MSARLLLLVLLAAVMSSALTVVWSVHRNRTLFIELQALHQTRDKLDVEWGQLQLEQSAWSTHGRIEQIARAKLHMRRPRPDEIVVVRP